MGVGAQVGLWLCNCRTVCIYIGDIILVSIWKISYRIEAEAILSDEVCLLGEVRFVDFGALVLLGLNIVQGLLRVESNRIAFELLN
jgi:hypothetical protein